MSTAMSLPEAYLERWAIRLVYTLPSRGAGRRVSMRMSAGPKMSEKQFSQQVVDLARLCGWKVYRVWLSVRSPAGFPDLFMVRGEQIVAAELKVHGKVTPAQQEWLDALDGTGKVAAFIWRPQDWEQIVELLR